MEIKREIYLSKMRGFYDSDLIKILVGIRRCGKSIILNQIIDELKEKGVDNDHIISMNFEEYENVEYINNPKKFHQYIKDKIKDQKIYYLFFDEIQNVNDFERVINSFRASLKNVSIFITGSNSKLLARELSTVLSGRYVSFRIHPLSYKEYILLTGKEPNNTESFNDFFKWGSLPQRVQFNNEMEIRNYLQNVFDSIIMRDVIGRLNIKDTHLFNLIVQYIVETTGREFSATNIVNYLKANSKIASTRTLYKYLDALCNALLINKVYRSNIEGKGVLKTLNKYYMTDLGIAQIKNNNHEINNSFAIENIVYNELLIREYKVYIGKTKKGEVDFVAKKDGKTKYIQVATFLSNDEKVIEREFGAFDAIDDVYPRYVITQDRDNYSRKGIIHKNIIDFLMEEDF